MFIAESALKCEDEVSAAFYIIHKFRKHVIARRIKRRNENHLVRGKIFAFGKNEIHPDVRTVQRTVHLPKYRAVVHTIAELHKLDAVMGIVAVKNRDLILALKIDDLRSDPFQLMCRAA